MRKIIRKELIISGTTEGGRKAAASNKAKYGEDFYKRIAAKGGRAGHNGGFGSDKVGKDGLTGRERSRIAGAKGGRKSTRLGVRNGEGKTKKKEYTLTEQLPSWKRLTKAILEKTQKTDTQ